LARAFQHEIDHLDGVLLLERLDPDTRKQALKTIRELGIGPSALAGAEPKAGGLSFGR
ncbi:MAG: peptide deformylase, partial [Acidimicrobiales bacterium]|nr:peptide deformylase [Acidimicrobiales bacterium]